METAAIIRKIDKLGRIVLPKELLASQRINDNDMLEIFTGENCRISELPALFFIKITL